MPFIFPTIHIYNYRTFVKYNSNTYKVKLLVSDYDCCAFNELGVISKSSFSSNKFCVSEMLHFIVVHMTILKHKNSPFLCTCCYDRMLNKLKFCQWVMYHVFHRVISLSGDVEENPGPPDYRNANTKVVARSGLVSNLVLETRLSELNRTAVDVGGGGDCFFRAVSHQLYGNPNYHFHLRSAGIRYLQQNPEQFIESNTDSSWQGYLTNMSCQGTWADAIIIQAVANCLNLSIHITESNETFAPVTILEPANVLEDLTHIHIGHIGETHYVSTVVEQSPELPNKDNSAQQSVSEEVLDKNEKRRIYIREYMKKRRTDVEFRKKENENLLQRRHNNIESTREQQNRDKRRSKIINPGHVREIGRNFKRKRTMENPEHVREINRNCKRKRTAEIPEHMREINKMCKRKQTAENREHIREINNNCKRKQTAENLERIREINKNSKRKQTAQNAEHIREINKNSKRKQTAQNAEHIREINKNSKRKQTAQNAEHIREINKNSKRKQTAQNAEHIREVNKNSKRK